MSGTLPSRRANQNAVFARENNLPFSASCLFGGVGTSNPKGPRTQIIGFQGPNTINVIVFGP